MTWKLRASESNQTCWLVNRGCCYLCSQAR